MQRLAKRHVRQQDQADCGVACLRTVLRVFGADASLERLRELSGTSRTGTTMLGLFQAAEKMGLEVGAYQAELSHLKACEEVCILHLVKEERLLHFIVCFGYDAERDGFLIADPAEPEPRWLASAALETMWQSRSLLLLKPTPKLPVAGQTTRRKWFWLRQLLRKDSNILSMALALGIVVAVFGLATAVFSQRLIDDILPAGDRLRLFTGVGILLALLLARSLLSFLRQLFLLQQRRDFNVRIIDHFYGRLLQLPKPFFDNRKTGDLIARMNDTQRIQGTIANLVSSTMIDALMVVAATGAIFYYDPQIGLLVLLWLPLFTWLVWRYHAPIVRGQQALMSAYARSESHYVDTIQGVADIKLANKQTLFTQLTKRVYGFFQQAAYDLGRIGIRFNLVTELAGALFIVGAITWSAVHVLDGRLSTGGLIAILQMMGIAMAAAAQVALVNIQLQEAKVAFQRMFEFTDLHSEYDEEGEKPRAVINRFEELRVSGLSFRFPGRPRLLDRLDFHLRRGEWIAVLGESGCGKSTLLQILQKFYTPESGGIKVNGIDLDLLSYTSWRDCLGVVSQEVKLFNGTLLDNVLLGDPPGDAAALQQFFESYGFHRYFSLLPQGYATIVGEEGVNLSGGQRRLVALARALWRRPQVLLLDEPTAALDRDTEHFVLDLLERLRGEAAILLCTHRLKTARRAGRIYLIEAGRIERQGDHRQLLQSDNLYSRAWRDLVA